MDISNHRVGIEWVDSKCIKWCPTFKDQQGGIWIIKCKQLRVIVDTSWGMILIGFIRSTQRDEGYMY